MTEDIASLPIVRPEHPEEDPLLDLNPHLVADWLVKFLQDECVRKRGISRAVIGLSGGVDSAVTTYLCARAFAPENTFVFRMPYTISSPESFAHAQLVIDELGLPDRTIDITAMADGYLTQFEDDASATRIGNVCARCRMIVLFDQSAKLRALPIGTGNKTERMFGYFTWHADDAPPINPLGDLYKTQVWRLAEHLGVPEVIIQKPPTADLVKGQTDEGDFGISYRRADRILCRLLAGWTPEQLIEFGFDKNDVEIVRRRVATTHWKRHLPTVAMLSDSAINEFYLRPVDY
ncbi:NAD+ synthase [Fimbriimonadia bacterium ATM]|nr:MAG: NAD+ synthase [Armatimonadota bacterium]MBC6970557.1 NAD+ synthase [Armatimonadota bacterium]MCE7900868.1 NAD+ synthase [Armatimonadetes bacterium ATM1]MDL1929727.1 NAD+ synthase [Fimbriimonadia bacterium ATM]RIJ95497.1 MAG: NAD(+) synthetase [Armatimonadota bacterium]